MQAILDYWRLYLLDYTYALAIVLGFFGLSRLLPRLLAAFGRRLSEKATIDYTRITNSFAKPLALLLVASGTYLAAMFLLGGTAAGPFFTKLFRSLIIILIAHGLLNAVSGASGFLVELGSRYELDKLFLSLLAKAMKALVAIISGVILIQEWGYDITGFIAGLGLGGLAFALAAQDTAANLIGGVVVLTEKPFTIGDWIVGNDIEGIVEDITFRSTRIRTFAQALVTVPNSSLAKGSITNWSRMGRRQILFRVGVARDTPADKLQQSLKAIRRLLKSNPDLHPAAIFVNLEKIGETALDIYVNCFTKTTAFEQWLSVREEVLFGLLAVMAKQGVALAVPAWKLYGTGPGPANTLGEE